MDRETGEIAVHKDRALSVEAKPTGLEEIDPRELSQFVGGPQPYLTYRYYQQPARLTLSVSKHELQEVVKTVVRRAYIEAVVTEDGPMTVRARYDLKSSERQRLAVTLHNPRILGVTVAGQTVAPEKAPARGGRRARRQDLFHQRGPCRRLRRAVPNRGRVRDAAAGKGASKLPTFSACRCRSSTRASSSRRCTCAFWTPQDYRLVGDPEGFVSHLGVGLWDSRAITTAPDNPDSWFPKDSSSFDFQVGGTPYLFSSLTGRPELKIGYWHIPTMTTVASLAVLAPGRRAAAVLAGVQDLGGPDPGVGGPVRRPVLAVAGQ